MCRSHVTSFWTSSRKKLYVVVDLMCLWEKVISVASYVATSIQNLFHINFFKARQDLI